MISKPRVGLHTAPYNQSEAGVPITNRDTEEICQYLDCSFEHIQCSNGIHRLFIKEVADACATLLIICGGEGKVFVLPELNFPDKLIFPLTTFDHLGKHNINVVVVDPSYVLPWGWHKLLHSATFTKVVDYILKSKTVISDAERELNPQLAVSSFLADLYQIVEYVRDKYRLPLCLAGHCSSAVLTSMFAERYPEFVSSLVLLSPFRSDQCKTYISNKITMPTLITQHRDDRCEHTTPVTANAVLSECANGRYVELSGGTDQGHKYFSIGYHGYRGIEDQLSTAIAAFIRSTVK